MGIPFKPAYYKKKGTPKKGLTKRIGNPLNEPLNSFLVSKKHFKQSLKGKNYETASKSWYPLGFQKQEKHIFPFTMPLTNK